MKANKGFTLIELLAVIVILAIIALIATPVILGVVETARKGAAQSSILGYIDAVEKQVMINEMDDTKKEITDGEYTIGELTTAGVTAKGELPNNVYSVTITKDSEGKEGVNKVKKGDVEVAKVTIAGGEVQSAVFVSGDKRYDVTYNKETGKATAETHKDENYAAAK